MRRWMLMAASLLLCSGAAFLFADDIVTIVAKSDNISEGLNLKTVANLFGEVKDLEEFEQKLNSDSLHLNNLDLNGDGKVDYLRVVETVGEGSRHQILIQAVLAKDIYQDIAIITVEKNDKNEMLVKLIGDVKVYGKDYVVEPVYIYRPVIYDWFWGSDWVCYSSPWYWGSWPGWYVPYPCWGYPIYRTHVYVYHYDHPRCVVYSTSTNTTRTPHSQSTATRISSVRVNTGSSSATRSYTSRTNTSSPTRSYSNGTSAYSATRSYYSGTNSSSTASGTRNYSSGANTTRSYSSASPSSSSRNYSAGSSGTSGSRSYSGTSASRR